MAAVLADTERLLKMEGVKLIAELLFSKVCTVICVLFSMSYNCIDLKLGTGSHFEWCIVGQVVVLT